MDAFWKEFKGRMSFISVKYLGQEGFILSFGDLKICFDLYLSNIVLERTGEGVRNYAPPCGTEELKDLDYCLISHAHLDHFDPPTLRELNRNSDKIRFICPAPYQGELEALGILPDRIIGARAGQALSFSGLRVHPIPQKHESYEIIDGEHGNLGYVLEGGGIRLYHAGDGIADKELAERLKSFGKFDIMFLPINGHDWKRYESGIMGNMTYREALDLSGYVGTELLVPMHYDLFGNNTENPAFFVDYLYRAYPGQKFKMFMPGEEIFLRGRCIPPMALSKGKD